MIARIKKWLADFFLGLDPRDVAYFLGVVSVGYGCWLVYPPAAYIVTGTIFIFVSLFLKKGG